MHRPGGSRLWGAFALLLTAMLASAAPAQGAFSGQNGRLAFERDGGIWTMNADASDPVRVAVSGDDPSWSPDGRRIVFEKSGAIYAADLTAAGSVVTNLTLLHSALGARRDPEFLPSGQIVYVEDRASPTSSWHLYRMEADGSSPTDLTPSYADYLGQPAANSAGKLVLFAGSIEKDIYEFSGSGFSNLTNTAFPISEGSPDLAPNGTVLFTRAGGAGMDSGLWAGATRLAGGPSDPNGQASDGAWSPDGTKIAFMSNSATNLWIMNADGSGKTQLTGGTTGNLFQVRDVDWGPLPAGAPAPGPTPAPGPPAQAPAPAAPGAAAPPAAPAALTRPTLTGKARVGRTLRCRAARFTGAKRITTSWLRNGKPIKGARRQTYTPTRRDAGKAISCRSTATGAGGTKSSTSKRLTVRR